MTTGRINQITVLIEGHQTPPTLLKKESGTGNPQRTSNTGRVPCSKQCVSMWHNKHCVDGLYHCPAPTRTRILRNAHKQARVSVADSQIFPRIERPTRGNAARPPKRQNTSTSSRNGPESSSSTVDAGALGTRLFGVGCRSA